MKITLSNVYPSYYNQEKSISNVSKYNSDLLKIENEIYQQKEICDTRINRLNDELSVKIEHLKTLNNAWMSIPYKKRPKKEDIEYLQILIIKYAMNIIGTGYTTWERFNNASNIYKDILNLMSSHHYMVPHDEACKQHIEQEHIEVRWSYCIQNFLIQLIYKDTPLEKNFLPPDFQYSNQYNIGITERVGNSITNARVAEFIFNDILMQRVDEKDYEILALNIKKLNDFYFMYIMSKTHDEYFHLKQEYHSITTETVLFIPQEIKDEITTYSD
ncbi:hypothetical protein J5069_17925 [Candidatus Symbiopectobacterium sp. NZEC127]|uniref:hypothetical protein n=1 Tax=Candidatus Symbiopectobacterium sp. NZEC127 TaxID=2820472 RepID=UPI0022269FD0|nr:hypothetical protein [Candidatus Symbiopectobacterium sp. NZEC127]MCW2487779.1 hypothetical protein [Candidatus Symbiopectobacterium sp. NZEC127]